MKPPLSPPSVTARSHHLLLDLYGCDGALLADSGQLVSRLSGDETATMLPDSGFHAFQPQGISGALLIGDTLLMIHTWPEKGYAAVDLFSRRPLDPETWRARVAKALELV